MDRGKQEGRQEFCGAARGRAKTPDRGGWGATARHDVVAAGQGRKEGDAGREVRAESREWVKVRKASWSACGPKAWTSSSATRAARLCRYTTRSRAAAFGTF